MHRLSEVPDRVPLLSQPHEVRRQSTGMSAKCDLCRETPYWPHEKGDLACVEACPVRALASTATPPLGVAGYEVDLEGEGWARARPADATEAVK